MLMAASFIRPPFPSELILQHIPTIVGLVLMVGATRAVWMTNVSFYCLSTFLLLHIVGARWIYSFVPYDEWSAAITGQPLSEQFGWQRNHYDRLVHLASGLLFVPPVSELTQRRLRISPTDGVFIGIAAVLAIGAVYEVLEWQIAMAFSPEMAESYNGQQGDIWDPQKDLALAGLGAIISACGLSRWQTIAVTQPDSE